jgi:hypothetical protein
MEWFAEDVLDINLKEEKPSLLARALFFVQVIGRQRTTLTKMITSVNKTKDSINAKPKIKAS